MSLTIEAIGAEALGSSAAERARLIEKLISSLEVDPEVEVDSQGRIHVLDGPGIGFEPNMKCIEAVTVRTEMLRT